MNLKALVALRKQKKITQEQIAEALGLSKSTYSRIEQGKVHLRASYLPIIAQELGMEVEQLVTIIFSQEVA